MKRNRMKVLKVVALLAMTLWITACNQLLNPEDAPIQHITLKEEAPLVDDENSPTLSFAMHYSWLNEKTDSMAARINHLMQREILGKEFAGLPPALAADSFKNTRIRQYRQEVAPLYQSHKAQASPEADTYAWYNHTYELAVHLQLGLNHIHLCRVDASEDQGGAHPDSWSRWLNIDRTSGKLLTREDIFPKAHRTQVEQALLSELIHQQAGQNPELTINTVEDLQQIGFLQATSIYIPENFLLEDEQVSFLYNRYDIAPYPAGPIILHLPYEEIKPYMNMPHTDLSE